MDVILLSPHYLCIDIRASVLFPLAPKLYLGVYGLIVALVVCVPKCNLGTRGKNTLYNLKFPSNLNLDLMCDMVALTIGINPILYVLNPKLSSINRSSIKKLLDFLQNSITKLEI